MPLHTPHGALEYPVFLPDATRAVVKSVDSADLEAVGLHALVMNAYHLMQNPGSTTVKSLGGLHQMSGWRGVILTDSGGFQIYSLIRQNSKYGAITENGAIFRPDGKKKVNLTPEKSIQLQFSYGADIMVCLDDCTHVDDPHAAQEESVGRTIRWAERCKAEFLQQLAARGIAESERPLLLGVVQGGGNRELRQRCAEALLAIGFDGFGYGGWPLDADNNLLEDSLSYVRGLVPNDYPVHALGVGHPPSIVRCVQLGYEIFDSAMPTRDARNGRLYTFRDDDPGLLTEEPRHWFRYLYYTDDKHIKAERPLSEHCDCPVCQRYSLGYLHHLYKIGDDTYKRFATIHNLRFMVRLMQKLRVTDVLRTR